MRTALVIGGGGSKGAFSVGAIEVLRELGIEFDVVVGTSTGALIAPLVAIDDIGEMVHQYTTVKTRDVIRKNWRGLFWRGLYHMRPLEKRIRRSMLEDELGSSGATRYRMLMKSGVCVLICAVDLQTGKVIYFSKHGQFGTTFWRGSEGFVKALMASASEPLLTPAVDVDGHMFVDGGVREVAPVGAAIRAGAEKIYVIINSPKERRVNRKRYRNLLSVGARSIDLMLTEITDNDVRYTLWHNRALSYIGEAKRKSRKFLNPPDMKDVFSTEDNLFRGKRHVELFVIRPKEPLLSDGLTFDAEVMQKMREIGQSTARETLGI